jgi:protein required for attachment to host cells
MHPLKKTWVVVTDSAHAKLFVPNEDVTMLDAAPLPGMPEVERHARDVTSDRPGRAFGSSGGGVRHAIEPHHDYHKMEKHDFVAALAKTLDRAALGGEFEHLIVIAPPRTVGELRTLMSDHVEAKLVRTIQKDLTKAAVAELWELIGPTVRRPPLTQS